MVDKAKMPAVPCAKSKDPALQKFYDAVKEHIEVRDGQRGDINESFVRIGDLVDGGVVQLYGRNSDGSVAVVPVDPLADTTRPPAPTGFAIATAFSHVMLEWDSWTYSNHAYTEIWRSDTDDLGTAVKIGISDGVLYADAVDPGSTHYYWIRFVSDANVTGPYNATGGTEGTTSQSVTQLMDAINDEIESSDLASTLISNINTVFRQTAAPTTKPDGTSLVAGDIWLDSDDGNKMYLYTGTAWINVQDGGIAQAISDAAGASGIADGKVTTYYQDAAPTTGLSNGDLWVDTNDGNKLYRYSDATSAWVDIQDDGVATAITNAADVQPTDNKVQTFYQDAAPTTGLGEGDLWVDTNDSNKLYRWQDDGAGGYAWASIIATAISDAATAQAAADGKITTFYQDAAPTAEGVGDVWFDTNDGNKMYRWQDDGSGSNNVWTAIPDADIAVAIVDTATAQNTADNKITTYYQDAQPTASGVGDFWVDTNDDDKLYTWDGSVWAEIRLATQAYVGNQIIEQVGYCQLTDGSGNTSVASAYTTKATCEAASPPTGSSYAWQNDLAIASEIKNISSSVDGNTTTISQNASSIDGLHGQWTVKIDNNGAVSGFGLASGNNICIKDELVLADKTTSASCSAAGGTWTAQSEFYINATRFAIIHPTNDGVNSPFVVDGADTYLANALIKDASITSAKIASLNADKINAATLSAINANIGTATAGLLKGPDNRFKIDLNNGYLLVYDASGNLRVRLGKLS